MLKTEPGASGRAASAPKSWSLQTQKQTFFFQLTANFLSKLLQHSKFLAQCGTMIHNSPPVLTLEGILAWSCSQRPHKQYLRSWWIRAEEEACLRSHHRAIPNLMAPIITLGIFVLLGALCYDESLHLSYLPWEYLTLPWGCLTPPQPCGPDKSINHRPGRGEQ